MTEGMVMIIKTEHVAPVTSAKDIAAVISEILKAEHVIDQNKEHWWVVGLDGASVIKYIELSALGLSDRASVAPMETFRLAIFEGITRIICVHNHPSGRVAPSESDDVVTKMMKASGDILKITLLDHIIVGVDGKYHSYLEAGRL